MFANRFTAVIDACVLYSPLKRNLILSLAEAELFRVRWSDRILDETQAAIQSLFEEKGCDDSEDRANRACNAINSSFVEAMVTDFESIANTIGEIPDDGDRHVMAAAIKSKADIIVTENLKDFPANVLAVYGIEVRTADEFIADAIDLNPTLSILAIKRMRLRLKKPEKTAEILLTDMEKIGLTLSADQLKDSVTLI